MDLIDQMAQHQLQPAQAPPTQPPAASATADVTAVFVLDSANIMRGRYIDSGGQGRVFEGE
jgi:hypothetical protein